MKKENQKHMALRVFLFVALLSLLGSANAQEPPVEEQKGCLHYAYTSSEDYNFLILNQSKVFGQDIRFIHNCEYLQVNLEGQFYAISNNSMILTFKSCSNRSTHPKNSLEELE